MEKTEKYLPIVGWIFLGIGVYLLINNFPFRKMIVFVSLGLIFIFCNKTEYFEVWSLKVKLRNTINEAENIINKLKAISIPLAKCALTGLISTGKIEPVRKKEKFIILDEVVNELKSLGVSISDIDLAREHFDKLTCHDIATPIRHYVSALLKKKMEDSQALDEKERIKNESNFWIKSSSIELGVQNWGILEKIDHFFSSSQYISKSEISEIKSKFRIDLENLKSYEQNKTFYDKNNFMRL